MEKKRKEAVWAANQLFQRGLVTGSTGNISFRDGDHIYISKSGSCFGTMNEDSFAKLMLSGEIVEGKPSKEYPIHLALYHISEKTQAVIHTHSFYTTLVSCLKEKKEAIDGLFLYTPYLKMKTGGNIKTISYHKPGTQELFAEFEKTADESTNVYIMDNHGAVAASQDIMNAFYTLEELEISAKTLCSIRQYKENCYQKTAEA